MTRCILERRDGVICCDHGLSKESDSCCKYCLSKAHLNLPSIKKLGED